MFIRSVVTTLCFVASIYAAPVNQSRMVHDLDLIKTIFEVKYAPAEWKKNYAGWDLDQQIQIAKDKVLNQNPTIRQYQKILVDFFNSMQDYHVNIDFYATELSFLPFRIQGAEGRYFIAWKSKDPSLYASFDPELEKFLSHIQCGDEVIMMGDMPVDQYVKRFREESFGTAATGTDQMMAEQFLTMRLASRGDEPQQGTLSVAVRHKETQTVCCYNPKWLYVPEEIKNSFSNATVAAKVSSRERAKPKVKLFNQLMMTPLQNQLSTAERRIKKFYKMDLDFSEDEEGEDMTPFMVIGQRESFIPRLGEVLWKNEGHFHAYIFKACDGKHVGYIRVPTFAEFSEAHVYFEELMARFEKETDALVIDLVNNPGGSAVYLFSLLAMVTDRPLAMPPERLTITQQDVAEALAVLEDPEVEIQPLIDGISGFSIPAEDLPDVVNYFQKIVEEWEAGRSFTNPLYFYGLSSIKPNPKTHYSKPLLVLVNALDFSCADFFPAILQDNKRAKIFGSKTAGAGGFVLQHQYPNLFGIQAFTYTGSIAYRLNDQPIENLGVTPDIVYEVTVEDILNNYAPYVRAVNEALKDL